MQSWTDQRMELTISILLRSGVVLSALVVLLGGACFLWQHGGDRPDYHVFHPVPESYRSIPGVVRTAGPSDYRALIQLGLLLLIATPIARVAFSLIAFRFERDWTYVWLTAVVLTILVYSFVARH